MSNFFNGNPYLHTIGGFLRDGANIEGAIGPAYFEALMNIKAELLKKSAGVTGFVNSMLGTSDVISDEFIEDGVYTGEVSFDYHANPIVKDMYDDAKASLQSICRDETINGVIYKTVTLNSNAGEPIKIVIDTDDDIATYDSSGLTKMFYKVGDQYALKQYMKCLSGRLISVWDAIHGLSIITEINDSLLDLIDICTAKGSDTLSSIISLTNIAMDYSSDKLQVLKDAAASFRTRGFAGLRAYIVEFWKQLCNIAVDQTDQTLQFVDNRTLVPEVYIGGMIALIGTTVASVGTMIMAAASKVVGAVLTLAGSIVSAIFNSISADYRSTYAGYQDDADGVYAAPYGAWQSEELITSPDDIPESLIKGETLLYYVPGGILLVGPGLNGKLRFEFHPDLINRVSIFEQKNNLYEFFTYNYTVHPDNSATGTVHFNRTATHSLPVLSDCIEAFAGRSNFYDAMPTKDGQYAGYFSDPNEEALLMKILCINTLIFLLTMVTIGVDETIDRDFTYDTDGHTPSVTIFSNCTASGNVDFYNSMFDLFAWTRDLIYLNAYRKPTWSSIAGAFVNFQTKKNDMYTLSRNFNSIILNPEANTYNEAFSLDRNFNFCLTTPQYSRSSFIANIVSAALISVAALAVTAFVSAKAYKAIQKKRTLNAAKVSKAYDDLVKDPSPENVAAYRKAVVKNNLWANVIGGTKFSKTDYWFGSNTSEPNASGVLNKARSISRGYEGNGEQVTNNDLYELISGHSPQIN